MGKILLADDERLFCQTTKELLQRSGYDCEATDDAYAAANKLRNEDFDLVIADIRMPGNVELEFVQGLREKKRLVPVILVTGYPALNTAIQSLNLHVEAYLVKPFDFDDLLTHVDSAIQRFKAYRTVREQLEQLNAWTKRVSETAELQREATPDMAQELIKGFAGLAFQNIFFAAADLKTLMEAILDRRADEAPCKLINCPTGQNYRDALYETVAVLEQTKTNFKSKTLADLRKKLERVLEDPQYIDGG